MYAGIRSLLAVWFALEPSASLMVCLTAVLLFGATFSRLRHEARFDSALVSPLFLGIQCGLVFIGIVGAFYVLLDSSYKVFKPYAESLARGEEFQKEVAEAKQNWGIPLYQSDLAVTQTFSHVEVMEVSGPNNSTLYINQNVIENVEQESVTRFAGLINIHLVDARLATYSLDARYEYEVVNQSDMQTTASFQFPLGIERTFKDLSLTVDGEEVGSRKRIEGGTLAWEWNMRPHQKLEVVISFVTQGMEFYVFQIPEKQPIQNFSLTVNVDTLDAYAFTQPDSTAIVFDSNTSANGYNTSWTIHNSIIAPYIGIVLRQKVQTDTNQAIVLGISRYMPRGLMLLLVMVVFTSLICSVPVDLWRLTLFTAVFTADFLALMGLDLLRINHPIILPLLTIPTLAIIFAIYRKLPRLPQALILFSAAAFLIVYPYSGLLSEGPERIAFDSLVQALIILYIFVLAFYVRVRGNTTVQ